jgi:UDP-2,3-diacylglucosamine pyrophosphatase LpxH
MRVPLCRLKPSSDVLERIAAAAMILVSSYQFGALVAHGQRRGAELAFLLFIAGICWQRSVFKRRAGRDAMEAIAGFAEATAMALRAEAVGGERAANGGSRLERGSAHRSEPLSQPNHGIRVRTVFISDVHLGTRGCQADQLIDFLRSHEAETLFLVGDIIDGWRLKSSWYWPKAHNDVVQELLHLAGEGKRLVYVAGNHDEFLRSYVGSTFGSVDVVEHAIHRGIDGRDYLIVHGDLFDLVVRHARWLALLGDWAYRAALMFNIYLNTVRSRLGLAYWSFSAWAKLNVKNAVNHIGRFEEVLSSEAKRHDVQGVICGHIHHAVMHDDFGVRYINTGDWVESCSAVVEHYDGQFEIIRWPGPRLRQTAVATESGSLAKVAA